jgi:voltage-gated potassium channel Kch
MAFDRTTSALAWRAVPVAAVFVLTVVAFEAGVEVSDRESAGSAGVLAHVYYAIGLFLLGGMDLGTPVGGPVWARAMLWGAYFLGPAITTTALAEGLVRLAYPRWVGTVRLRRHLVIVGAGPTGLLYLDAALANEPDRWVVVVDLDDDDANAAEVRRRRNVSLVRGDIRRPAVRELVRLDRAHGLVLATGSDLTNLEVCWEELTQHPRLPIAAQVNDLGMRRKLGEIGVPAHVRVFNAHETAARHLYRAHLARHFEHTGARDVVVLAGFGRFGQTILEYLKTHAQGEVAKVIVLDRQAEARGRAFDQQVGFDPRVSHDLLDVELGAPDTWDRVAEALREGSEHPVVVLCTDDDAANLQAAMVVRERLPGARAFVRQARASRFTADLAQRVDFEVLPVEELLAASLRAHHRDCFHPKPA